MDTRKIKIKCIPNAFNTCLDIWYLINNPVSKELVSFGLDYGNVDNKIDLDYYLVGSNFYTNSVKFNNFVIVMFYDKHLSTLSSPDLLDGMVKWVISLNMFIIMLEL